MPTYIGETIGRYRIVEEIGRGGLAVVLRAVDTILERSVAVKMILPEQQQSDKFLKRFNREAKALAGLSHPSIVKVLDYGEHQGTPYLVMEYIPGGTLSGRMGRTYSYVEAAAILAPIAHALNHSHQHKVVHRDVKPANILINESGQPMLSDFGIVKLTETDESQSLTGTGIMIGTPAYMAPEQIQGRTVDGRADIYALGIVFFELITGRKPYVANTPIELTLKHLHEPVPRPRQIVRDLPPEVEQIVMRSMAKKPEDRYQDMATFAAVLDRLASGQKGSLKTLERPPDRKREPTGERQRTMTDPAGSAASSVVPGKKGPSKKLVFGLGGAGLIASVALVFGLLVYPGVTGKATPTPTHQPTAIKMAQATSKPTQEPTVKPSPTATRTAKPSATPIVEVTPVTTLTLPSNAINPENANRLVELNRIEKASVIQIDWTRDGQWIVDAGSNRILLIDPATMKASGTISLGLDVPKSIALTQDSQQIFVLIGNQIKVFNMTEKQEERKLSVQGGPNSMALSGDAQTIALGMLDNKVLLLDAQTGSSKRVLRSNYGGWSVAFSPDGKLIASGTSQGALMWETETGNWLPLATGQENLIKSLAFSNDGRYLAGGSDNIVRIWDVETGDEVAQLKENFGQINSLQFSPDDQLLVTGSTDYTVRIWEVSTWKQAAVLKNHVSNVFSVVFSPTGQQIASGANEGVVRLWGLP